MQCSSVIDVQLFVFEVLFVEEDRKEQQQQTQEEKDKCKSPNFSEFRSIFIKKPGRFEISMRFPFRDSFLRDKFQN